MKRFWKEILFAGVLGLMLPWLLTLPREGRPTQEETTLPSQETEAAGETQPTVQTVNVLLEDGSGEEMELEAYLTGVLLGEMPADFEMEAKKAQAVVARTYALRAKHGHSKHDTADVCTDAACCQGYFAPEDYIAQGGGQEAVDAAQQAAEETIGQVLTYNGELIEATYFSCSGGRTEDAAAVWGADVPYLQATDSPGEENADHFTDTVMFTTEEFAAAIGAEPEGVPGEWIGEITYTDGGGVDEIQIGGETYGGTELRKALGLRSTAFSISAVGDSVIITTRGYGHRVGMSQYGADAMAVQGSTYQEILAHYYQGTSLAGGD